MVDFTLGYDKPDENKMVLLYGKLLHNYYQAKHLIPGLSLTEEVLAIALALTVVFVNDTLPCP